MKTRVLSPQEWRCIKAAAARLIPSDGEGPGGCTRIPVFVDLQSAGECGRADDCYMTRPHDPTTAPERGWQAPLNPAQLHRQTIPAFDAQSRAQDGMGFAALDAARQKAALKKGDAALGAELAIFPTTLLANTKEGCFADPFQADKHGTQSWFYTDFPGARAACREWPKRRDIRFPLGPDCISGERG